MAYIDQEKCISCGKSIPKQPEDATYEEMLCDGCRDEFEMVNEAIATLRERGHKNPDLALLHDHVVTRMRDYGEDFQLEQAMDGYLEDVSVKNA